MRDYILQKLDAYIHILKNKKIDSPHDFKTYERIKSFVESTPHCFERTHLAGHVTGSALIVDSSRTKVLLMLHKKLNKWLQMGGHSDGNHITHEVAMREAYEESGLEKLTLTSDIPFDLDTHVFPARGNEPEHIHYDVRYLVIADEPDKIVINEESAELKWFTFDEAIKTANEESITRQLKRIKSW